MSTCVLFFSTSLCSAYHPFKCLLTSRAFLTPMTFAVLLFIFVHTSFKRLNPQGTMQTTTLLGSRYTTEIPVPKEIQSLWGAYTPYFPVEMYRPPPRGCKVDQVRLTDLPGGTLTDIDFILLGPHCMLRTPYRLQSSFNCVFSRSFNGMVHGTQPPAQHQESRVPWKRSSRHANTPTKASSSSKIIPTTWAKGIWSPLELTSTLLPDLRPKFNCGLIVLFTLNGRSAESGALVYERYHKLVSKNNIPFVRASSAPRVVDTATNWTAGALAEQYPSVRYSLCRRLCGGDGLCLQTKT